MSTAQPAMSEDDQRIAIAEACGWKRIDFGEHYDNQHEVYGEPPVEYWQTAPNHWRANEGYASTKLPNYLSDLNAMHEAEKVLTGTLWDAYYKQLDQICYPSGIRYATVHATAAQRAEAFLRTLNLWKPTAPTTVPN